MSRFKQTIARYNQVWIAGLVVLALAMVWAGGTTLIKTSPAGGFATSLSAELSPVDVAILTASGSTPRFSEFRPGHDPDDMALHAGAACVQRMVGTETVPQAAVERCAEPARALPQARAPPLT